MKLIYFSPVHWSSFAQRPHKFVEWFHKQTSGNVIWVEPYPTRLPELNDFRNLKRASLDKVEKHSNPSWLKLVSPRALPIEPLPFSKYLNSLLWNDSIGELVTFAKSEQTILVIGKPSNMAIQTAKTLTNTVSIYDAMDNFPSFYSGLSRWSIARKELSLVGVANKMFVSSTELKHEWDKVRNDIVLIRNGLDVSLTPSLKTKKEKEYVILGYIGTVAKWFDWDWVVALATLRPDDRIRICGPVFNEPPDNLPANIQLSGAVAHADALKLILEFDVGLIPFKINTLTKYVDPIKYYEYKAAGLPILSTSFGEMLYRKDESGVFLANNKEEIEALFLEVLSYQFDSTQRESFLAENSWQSRFESMQLI